MGATYHASVEELTKMYGWSRGYVYRLASEEGWRRKRDVTVTYDLRDVARHVALTRMPKLR
jgi:hypothetical protein